MPAGHEAVFLVDRAKARKERVDDPEFVVDPGYLVAADVAGHVRNTGEKAGIMFAAGLDLRVDHRSLAAQGIDREPQPKIPFRLLQMEQRGVPSEVAERIRAAYRERVAARAARQALAAGAEAVDRSAEQLGPQTQGVEDVRRRAREAWMALRREALAAAGERGPGPERNLSEDHAADRDRGQKRAVDEDLGL